MSENLTDLAVTQFSAILEMKTQQQTSHLRGKTAEGAHKGKQASPVNYIGPVKVNAPVGRFSPLPRTDAQFERRWVFPLDRDINQLIDTFDELRLISDPKSQYSSNSAAAVGREYDNILIASANASASTGTDVNGLSAENFDDTTYGIAVDFGAAAATGLTVKKLVELRRKLRHYAEDGDANNDQLTIVIGSQQEADLLGETQVTSAEFNGARPTLVEGSITRFVGFDFVISERLQWGVKAANTRTCLAFMKSGLYLGTWRDMTTSVSTRNDLSSHPYQLYVNFTCGGTRLQKGKLFVVYANDTTGVSIVP